MTIIRLCGQQLKLSAPVIAADTIDYIEMAVEMSEDWQRMDAVFVRFELDNYYVEAQVRDGRIRKEQHLNLTRGSWRVSAYGVRSSGEDIIERITSTTSSLDVKVTGAHGGEPLPPDPGDIVERLKAQIAGKLDKQQNAEDAGKVLGIGEDGRVVPVEGGGGDFFAVPMVEVEPYAYHTEIAFADVLAAVKANKAVAAVINGEVYPAVLYSDTSVSFERSRNGTAGDRLKWLDLDKSGYANMRDITYNRYSKPATGIPESDLSADVRIKLNSSGDYSAVEAIANEAKDIAQSVQARADAGEFDGNNFTAEYDADTKTLTFASNSNKPKGKIKILGIGNSWCRDTMRWLWAILNDAGYEPVIGQSYMGAASLQTMYFGINDVNYSYTHQTWQQNAHHTYQYWRYSAASPVKTPGGTAYANGANDVGMTLEEIVKAESWDVILFMGTRGNAGHYTQYVNADTGWDINSMIDIVKGWCPTAKIGWITPWFISETTTGSHMSDAKTNSYADYWAQSDNDTSKFYELVNSAMQRETVNGMAHMGDRVHYHVNVGQALYYARKCDRLKEFGYDLQRAQDNSHLAVGMPMFIAGFAVANAVCDVGKNDVSFYPDITTDSLYTDTDTGNTVEGVGVPTQAIALMGKACAVKANSDLLWLN